MPNPLNNVRGEQWDNCDRCGRLFPMSKLTKQRGLLLCSRDFDNLEVERAPQVIARILSTANDEEGADLRYRDRIEPGDSELF